MNSRTDILSRIKKHKPTSVEIPDINLELFHENINPTEQFSKMVTDVGGQVVNISSDLLTELEVMFPDAIMNFSTLQHSEKFNSFKLEDINTLAAIEPLDILVIEASFGVAENAAIWVSDDQIPIRIMPFIAKHLVIVLNKSSIVPTMHDAYGLLEQLDYGFGVFISGPSKTADIEQSLVIGAQGALSLSVYLK